MYCGGSHLGFPINISQGQLKPNCPGMIIRRSSVLYADRKSKMAATTGHSINTGPYEENTEICSLKKDIPMIIHLQFGFSQFISFREDL
jgi:hypothetical protein